MTNDIRNYLRILNESSNLNWSNVIAVIQNKDYFEPEENGEIGNYSATLLSGCTDEESALNKIEERYNGKKAVKAFVFDDGSGLLMSLFNIHGVNDVKYFVIRDGKKATVGPNKFLLTASTVLTADNLESLKFKFGKVMKPGDTICKLYYDRIDTNKYIQHVDTIEKI